MILDDIAAKTRERVEISKKQNPLKKKGVKAANPFAFEKAVSKNGVSFICEVKKGSPSKGVIVEDFPYVEIAKEYEAAGADAISVLTEPFFFLGKNEYLAEISKTVNIPVLRKDFIIDGYQIYEAAEIGASAVLLIAALLDAKTLEKFIKIADGLGLSALVETRDGDEINSALKAGARIIGVNNRDLKTFETDVKTSARLRGLVPRDVLFVAESGIKTRKDILELGEIDAVLIGETLMRSADKKRSLDELKGITRT
ncbi:MAG: indole-3-glycerol phosphate synthase TrpC [Oscillospiraceae bacterium]|jgi:indole-3-glycerol phosphate synthase|nr:indole-3-glycerol phosphate synthase TrpC [Oscillospiraceae bacterium]